MAEHNDAAPLEFFTSSNPKAKWTKWHLELMCTGVRRQPVSISTLRRFDEESNLFVDGGVKVTAKWLDSEEMGLEELIRSTNRPCRLCTLETVLDHGAQVGTPSVAVTFSGQFVPDEIGVNVFEWEAASENSRSRLRRIAERMALRTVETSSGPAAFGLVTPSVAALLKSNLRSYELSGGLAELCSADKVASERAGYAFESYWMLRNHRPPEVYTDQVDVAQLATALAHQ